MIPPKFASFLAPQNIPPDFHNKLDHIKNVNTALIGLNRCVGEKVCVWLNTYGVRNRKGKRQSHKMHQFAEKETSKKLHFTPEIKAEAALEIAKYFATK